VTWAKRNEIDFDGRTGFLRLAADMGVPIVPAAVAGTFEAWVRRNIAAFE